jgi:DNA-binding response OmpR family regulator
VVNTLNLRINPVKRTIEDTGDDEWRVISLSAQDSSLFWHLWESKKIVSADEIAEKVFGWSNALNNRNAVIAAVKRLREKIEKDVHNPQIILSARGKGYYIGI